MVDAINLSRLTDPVSFLLARLERVRQYATCWRTDCPCVHTSHGTLSVKVGDDGRLLLHCFAACEVQEIVRALGLEVADLFPQREKVDLSPPSRARRRELVEMGQRRAALSVLCTEAAVIEVAGTMIERGDVLPAAELECVRIAAYRIHAAREMLQ